MRISKKISKQRAHYCRFILRKAYPSGFRQYETADVIVNRIHALLFANREILKQCCTKRMLVPLNQMTGDRTHDKRHVICFLRRVCTQYDYGFVVRKRSWRRMSVYEYGVTAVLKSAR